MSDDVIALLRNPDEALVDEITLAACRDVPVGARGRLMPDEARAVLRATADALSVRVPEHRLRDAQPSLDLEEAEEIAARLRDADASYVSVQHPRGPVRLHHAADLLDAAIAEIARLRVAEEYAGTADARPILYATKHGTDERIIADALSARLAGWPPHYDSWGKEACRRLLNHFDEVSGRYKERAALGSQEGTSPSSAARGEAT